MSQRVTLRDVAREAGVGVATVSRALANASRCAAGTRARVKAVAERLGYRPDPALAALVTHRSGVRRKTAYNLGLVSEFGFQGGYLDKVFRAYVREAEQLGYAVERHDPRAYPSPRRLAQVLESQGVRGIVWGWLHDRAYLDQFPWGKFAHLGFVLPLVHPPINRVRDDCFHTLRVAMEQVWAAGWKRPGLALMTDEHSENDPIQEAVWLLAHHQRGVKPLPVWKSVDESRSSLRAWIEKWRPDGVVGNALGIYHRLRGLGLAGGVPYLGLDDGGEEYAGFDCCEGALGEALASIIDGYVRRNLLGLPQHPREILIKRVFKGGAGWGRERGNKAGRRETKGQEGE